MRFSILGAGGVGGWYAGLLALGGNEVSLLARGEHLAAIKAKGLELKDASGTRVAKLTAVENHEELGEADVVIITGAVVLPLLNGVDAADELVKAGVPKENVLGGVTQISASKTAPGVITKHSPFSRIILGELPPLPGVSDRVTKIKDALAAAGIEAMASPNIEADLWKKMIFIASFAATSGLARAYAGAVRKSAGGRDIVSRAIEEAVAVGKAKGVAISEADGANALNLYDGLHDGIKPSLLLDVEKGGRTEVAALSGALSRMGKELKVPTPVHDVAAALIGLS